MLKTYVLSLLFWVSLPALAAEPIATLKGEPIVSVEQVQRLLIPDSSSSTAASDKNQQVVIDELVRQAVFAREAVAVGFEQTPEIAAQLKQLQQAFLAQAYAKSKVKALPPISDEALQQFYREHQPEFWVPESVEVSVVSIPKAWFATSDQTVTLGKQVQILFKQGITEAALQTLDKRLHLTQTTYTQLTLPDYAKTAWSLNAGEVSDVIDMGEAYWLAQIKARKPGYYVPLEQVKTKLRDQLTEQQEIAFFKQWEEELYKRYDVKVNPYPFKTP